MTRRGRGSRLCWALALATLPAAPALAASGHEGGGLGDLVWPLLNLGILLGVLFHFARAPIRAFFADRRDQIRRDVEGAAELLTGAEARHVEWQRRLADLDRELDEIRSSARRRAEAERDRILGEAAAAAERVRADARVAVEQELRRAREQLREETSLLALQLAVERLREQVTPADRERLLDEFIEHVEHRPSPGVRA